MKSKDKVLVTLANERYLEYAKVMLSSAYHNGGWDGDYLLLANNIPEKDLKWFRERGIEIMKCEKLYKNKFNTHPGIITAKLNIFKPYFKKWKHVLFLDGDIIVRSSLRNLPKTDTLLAVPAYLQKSLRSKLVKPSEKDPEFLKKEYKRISSKYKLSKTGFNTGVLLINTEIINKNTFKDLEKIAKKFGQIYDSEEGMLGIYFDNAWQPLPKAYNIHMPAMKKLYGLEPQEIDGIILHFIGKFKGRPWNKNNSFHPEWLSNKKKADKINSKTPRKPRSVWSESKIQGLEKKLKRARTKKLFKKIKRPLKNNKERLSNSIKNTINFIGFSVDRKIGQTGLIIKKISPSSYLFLRKLLFNKQ